MRRLQITAAAFVATLALAGAVYAAGSAPAHSDDPLASLSPAPVAEAASTAEAAEAPSPAAVAACECPLAAAEAPQVLRMSVRSPGAAALKAQYDALIEALRASGDITDAGVEKMQQAFEGLSQAAAPQALCLTAPAPPQALMELKGLSTIPAPSLEGMQVLEWRGGAPNALALQGGALDPELKAKIEAEVAEALKAAGVADGQALELQVLSGPSAEQQAKIEAEVAQALKAAGVAGGQAPEIDKLGALKSLEGLKELEALKALQGAPGLNAGAPSADELAKLEAELSQVLDETLPQLEERLAKLEAELAGKSKDS